MRVAGYIKLAKLWERRRDAAIKLHTDYFQKKCGANAEYDLVDVFIDITGQKSIFNRAEMVRLLQKCLDKEIDLIITPTRAYLAANMEEFCYLLHFLFTLKNRIDIITEEAENNINTISNDDHVRESLAEMAADYAALTGEGYQKWKNKIIMGMNDHKKGAD